MPLPKRKHSKGRRDRRRSKDELKKVAVGKCRFCQAAKITHRVCAQCGRY